MVEKKGWHFITNHGLVLLYISGNPESTTREMALALNVTERTIRRVLDDLAHEGYISWRRKGRGNAYNINTKQQLRHTLTRETPLGDLLKLLSAR
jgi:DNA-binding MarR family transcriptional regulator